MKVTTSKPSVTFAPVSVTLTFESQAELDAYGSLFNCTLICDALNALGAYAPDYNIFEGLGGNINKTSELSQAIAESSYFKTHYIKKI